MFNSLLISSALLGLIVILKLFHETDVGKWLNRVFVDAPAAWLLKVTAWQIVAIGIAIIGVAALVPTIPFDLALMAVGDVTAYLEVLVAVSTIAVSIRWKSVLRTANKLAMAGVMNIAVLVRRRAGSFAKVARRSLRLPSSGSKGNDDDGGWQLCVFAA